MTQTQHYQLNQWEPDDQVKRTDFNADNAKVDAALGALSSGKADKAGTESRLTALEGRVEVKAGSYTGDGAATRTISLGFTPKAVLVEAADGMRVASDGTRYGGLALPGLPVEAMGGRAALQVVAGGFQVFYESGYVYTNTNGVGYRYLAFK